MRIAAYQCTGRSADIAHNLDLLRQAAQSASVQGARLLICPELFLSGYNIGDAMWELAQPIPGSMSEAIANIASEYSIAIVYGYPERVARQVYNSVGLVDHTKSILANYRKITFMALKNSAYSQPVLNGSRLNWMA